LTDADKFFVFQAEDGIRLRNVTGVQTCALPILLLTNIDAVQRYVRENLVQPNDGNKDCGKTDRSIFNISRETESFGDYKYNDFDGKHYGIDYGIAKNTPVTAATDGKVTRTFENDLGGKVVQ